MPWVSAIYAAHFAHGARALGARLQAPPTLQALGRPPILTDRMALGELLDFIEALVEHTRRRDLGVLVAHHVEDHDSALFHLVAASDTAGEGLDEMVRYSPLLGDGFCYAKRVDDGEVQLSLQRTVGAPQKPSLDVLIDFELAAVALACRLLFPPHGIPSREVWLRDGGAAEAFAELCRCPVRSGMPVTMVRFDSRGLGRPPLRPNPILAGYLRRQLAGWSEALPRPESTVAERVREHLQRAVSIDPSAAACAAALGMSERTMSRRLQDEGTQFQDELDAVRCELARSWLPHLPLHEITERLGYSEESAFRRAFRRWTGAAPSKVRRALRER